MRFFGKKKIVCPINEETRIWIENSLIWLINQFGDEKLINKKTLTPEKTFFPINFDGSKNVVFTLLPILCKQMEIEVDNIQIDFYNEKYIELNRGSHQPIFTQQFKDQNYSSGLYFGKSKDEKYLIGLEEALLNEPDKLISTIAHELAHVKIAGENRLQNADERLIDLVTVFFGIGIFNANSAVIFYKSSDRWGYSKQGYFTQQEWGYSLALYAYIRQEHSPGWLTFLTPNVKSDFQKSQKFIYANTDKVLV